MSKEYDPFRYLAKKYINKLYGKHGDNVAISFPYISAIVANELLQDKRFQNLLMEMVKDVVRTDDDYMITKGKFGGVRKTSKSRKKKVKLVSCDGARESFLTAQAEAFVGGMSDE